MRTEWRSICGRLEGGEGERHAENESLRSSLEEDEGFLPLPWTLKGNGPRKSSFKSLLGEEGVRRVAGRDLPTSSCWRVSCQ